jgi:hypothetical protein
VASRAVELAPTPKRFEAVAFSRNDESDLAMFDGAARRRRIQWLFALVVLLALAAAAVATVASHFRPT